MSDLISQRELRRTHLYHEIFKPVDGGHQIVLPLITPGHVAAFTINRDAPFTDAELCLARLLGPHLALAHIHAQHLTALKAARRQNLVRADDGTRFGLTARETEVLRWIAEGKRDGEIAVILGIARKTVSKHVERILAKLGVETRGAAALSTKKEF